MRTCKETPLFVGGHWAATGAATGRPLGGHWAATVRWQLTPSEYQRNTNGSIPFLQGGANCWNVQGRAGRCQCWGAARGNLPIVYSHMQKGTSLFSVHFMKLSKSPHLLPLLQPELKKQHHYLLPLDLRWEGSSVYLFALITNYLHDVCTSIVTFRSP